MGYSKTKELLNPTLNLLNTDSYLNISDIITKLAKIFDLDESFLAKRYEISNAKIFDNTVLWKLNDLEKAGLIKFIKESGVRKYIISEAGRKFLNSSNDEIVKFIRKSYLKKFKKSDEEKTVIIEQILEDEQNPIEQLEQSYKAIRAQIYDDILDNILSKSPVAFESIVALLLQKMGYGDGEVTQVSRDGGIDAIIKGDVLGFEQIYVQAKRYQRDKKIGRQDIQGFTGALLGLEGNATKGVFITTARFSQDAENFAKNFSKARIVLIDGAQLAKYIYQYELGVQVEKEFSIKKLDNDFWDNLPNDNQLN